MAADLQDPPELIPAFIRKWEAGESVVLGVKTTSEESAIMFAVRKAYYSLIDRLSEVPQVRNNTGFGLYDQSFLTAIRQLSDPSPYFRGIVAELGFRYATIAYAQPKRRHGVTSNNFYTLYDLGIQGIVNHSKIPLRLATMLGFCSAALSFVAAVAYFIVKLLFWNKMTIGIAPLVIGMFFVASVQLFFLGVMGEYIGAIYTQVRNRPLVVERERINFDDDPPRPSGSGN
jgi:hypothetical protein